MVAQKINVTLTNICCYEKKNNAHLINIMRALKHNCQKILLAIQNKSHLIKNKCCPLKNMCSYSFSYLIRMFTKAWINVLFVCIRTNLCSLIKIIPLCCINKFLKKCIHKLNFVHIKINKCCPIYSNLNIVIKIGI